MNIQLLQAFNSLLEISSSCIYIKDQRHTFIVVNKSFADLAGTKSDQIIGTTDDKILQSEILEYMRAADNEVLSSGKPILRRVESVRDSGGNTRTFLASRIPLTADENQTTAIICIMEEITELQRMKLLLGEAERRYSSLYESNLVGLFQTRISDGTIIKANGAAAKILNYDSAEKMIADKVKVSNLYSPERRAQLVKELSEHGMVSNFDAHYTLPDGTERDILISARVYPQEGYLEGAVIDISEKKTLEAQLRQSEKMQAIGTLAGGIAHDFNNQLTGIMGCAQYLDMTTKDNKECHAFIEMIKNAVRHSSNLTGQLLAFARKGKYQSIPLDMHTVVGGAAMLLEHSLDKKYILTRRLDAVHPWVAGDPNQLQDVIINLVLNARDAMPDGGEILIRTENMEADDCFCKKCTFEIIEGSYVCLSVSDTGIGMEKKVQDRIFEPFFTTKETSKGTGLGLASVYGAIQSHRGAIEVDSRPGQGTTFRVYIPLSPTRPEQQQAGKTREIVHGKGSILLVDDEESVRTVMTRALEQIGYTMISFASGHEAVSFYKTAGQKIDLVILDMIMPGLDGYATYMALHEINSGLKAIFCSGFTVNEKARELIRRGTVGFISKPFDYAELASIINRQIVH